MTFKKLNIEIPYPKQLEIVIEFPLNVLAQYKGLNNLDETWDDHILPMINQVITELKKILTKFNA